MPLLCNSFKTNKHRVRACSDSKRKHPTSAFCPYELDHLVQVLKLLSSPRSVIPVTFWELNLQPKQRLYLCTFSSLASCQGSIPSLPLLLSCMKWRQFPSLLSVLAIYSLYGGSDTMPVGNFSEFWAAVSGKMSGTLIRSQIFLLEMPG